MKTLVALISLLIAHQAMAQTPTKFQTDVLQFGRGTSLLPKELIFDAGDGASNKKFSLDPSDNELDLNTTLNVTGNLEVSADVLAPTGQVNSSTLNVETTSVLKGDTTLGDGTNADQTITVNRATYDPFLRWKESIGKWVFSNDGTIEKPFGSGSGSGDGGINLLENPSFEDGVTVDWTSTCSSFTGQVFANPKPNDATFARCVASAPGEYFESVAKVVPTFFQGGCIAYGYYNTTTNNAFTLQFIEGSTVINQITLPTTNGLWLRTPTVSVRCPAAGQSIKVRGEALLAATIDFDSAYLGNENRLVYPDCKGITACEDIVSAFVTDGSGTTTVSQETPGSWINGSCTNPSAGLYVCTFDSGIFTVAPHCWAESTLAKRSGLVSSTSSAVNIDWEDDAGASQDATFTLYCRKQGADFAAAKPQTAVTSEASGWKVDANIGGANASLGTANVASYTEVTNSALDMVLNLGSSPAKIPCSSTNASTGLTCSAGNEGVGVVFVPPVTGDFEVCAYFGHNASGNAGTSVFSAFQLVETTPNTQTIIQEGRTRVFSGHALSGGTSFSDTTAHTNCGTFTFTSTTEKTIRLMYEQTVTGTPGGSLVLADRGAALGQNDIHITVRSLTLDTARPVLTGDQVTTPGVVDPVSFSFRSSATGVISNALGTYSPSSCVITGTSVFTCAIPPLSAAPNCTCSPRSDGECAVVTDATTSTQIQFVTETSAGAVGAIAATVICHGVK